MKKGANLIFLVSQPRSGSTMLQRILGRHPSIGTTSEPWLMLSPIRILSDCCSLDGAETKYSRDNVQRFLEKIEKGKKEYIKSVRKMYSYLYRKYLDENNEDMFLDKTPRYAYILPELRSVFPEAHFIILFRNPVAVLFSIINTFTGYRRDLFTKHYHSDDLLEVPSLLIEHIEENKEETFVVNYENILKDPEKEVISVLKEIGVEKRKLHVGSKNQGLPKWNFGDQKVYDFEGIETSRGSSWKQDLEDPTLWRAASLYIDKLKKGTVEKMGYSYPKICNLLAKKRPNLYEMYKLRLKEYYKMFTETD